MPPKDQTNPILSDAPPDSQLSQYEQFVDAAWTGGEPEYTMIALAGEVGEACNEHKKIMRHSSGPSNPDAVAAHRKKKVEELGDALYYLVRACHDEGVTLRDVMLANEKKLHARKAKFGSFAKPD